MTEREIQNQIIEYLTKRGIDWWRDRQGIRRPGRGTYKESAGKSDIMGFYKKKFFAIEVKRPGGTTEKSRRLKQQEFIDMVQRNGHLAFIAYSLRDVLERMP